VGQSCPSEEKLLSNCAHAVLNLLSQDGKSVAVMGWDKDGFSIGGEWRTNDPSSLFGEIRTSRLSEDHGIGFVARGGAVPADTTYGDVLCAADAFCKSTIYKAAYYAKGYYYTATTTTAAVTANHAAPTTITRTASTTTSTPLTGTNCVSFTLAMERVILSPGRLSWDPECGGEPFRFGAFSSLLVFTFRFCSVLLCSVLFRSDHDSISQCRSLG
jgi:hypothetical protein